MFFFRGALAGVAAIFVAAVLAYAVSDAHGQGIDFDRREFAREEQNLAAQWGIQAANEEMVRLTRIQLYLGLATLVGLFVTLQLSRAALTRADQTLAQTREMAQIELRSYISIEQFTPTLSGARHCNVKVTVANRGRTPATNMEVRRVLQFIDHPDYERVEWPEVVLAGKGATHVSLQPDGTAYPECSLTLSVEEFSALVARRGLLYVAVEVSYRDVFGATHERRAGVAFKGGTLKVHPVPGHNIELTRG